MSNVLSFAEIGGQYVELLPARTVMSLFGLADPDGGGDGDGGGSADSGGDSSTAVTNTCSAFLPTTTSLLGLALSSSGGGELCGSGSTVTH